MSDLPGEPPLPERARAGDSRKVETEQNDGRKPGQPTDTVDDPGPSVSAPRRAVRLLRELAAIAIVALIASALLRAFVVQAFFVPSGSMIPAIQPQDRILVSKIGDVQRGQVVVFQDPGGWIPPAKRPEPPNRVQAALEWVGVLPASSQQHLVKRVIGLPGDHVICCRDNKITINDVAVDESAILRRGKDRADNVNFDVIVPADSIFVLGDNRYISGDSSRHLTDDDPFVPMDLVVGRAVTIVWPPSNAGLLRVPDAYADVRGGQTPPDKGVIHRPS